LIDPPSTPLGAKPRGVFFRVGEPWLALASRFAALAVNPARQQAICYVAQCRRKCLNERLAVMLAAAH